MSLEPNFHDVADDRGCFLEREFILKGDKQQNTVKLSISRDKLTYRDTNGAANVEDSIAWADVVGCRSFGAQDEQSSAGTADSTNTSKDKNNDKSGKTKVKLSEHGACLQIFVYKYNKQPKDGGVRRRLDLRFVAEEHETQKENLALVERWKLVILSLLRRVEFVSVDDLTEALLPPPPHYLVCINPHSGKGKAGHIFRHQVKPVFNEAGVTYKTITTERQGHGFELAKSLDLKEYNGIIIVSGDGLIYEFIQGFKERPDREEALKMPFGLLPGGSGNALCAAVLATKGEQLQKSEAMHAAVGIVKGRSYPKDLVHIQTNETDYFSFLSVAWGIIADIDIESERFRALGDTRFTIGAVQRILFLRKHAARIAFLPIEDETPYAHLLKKIERKKSTKGKKTGAVDDTASTPTIEGGKENVGVTNHNQNSNAASSAAAVARSVANGNASEYGITDLPSLDEPVPPNWTVIEGDFVGVIVAFMSHLSRDFIAHPNKALSEDVICLQYMSGSTTRSQLIKSFDDFKTGEYLREDNIKVRFVKAFRLEPLNDSGIMTVDGERVQKYGPIQGVMMSLKCHVLM